MRNSGETPRKLELIPNFLGEPFLIKRGRKEKIYTMIDILNFEF